MVDVGESVVVVSVSFDKRCARDTEARIGIQPLEQEFEIVRFKGNVCVKTGDDLKRQFMYRANPALKPSTFDAKLRFLWVGRRTSSIQSYRAR